MSETIRAEAVEHLRRAAAQLLEEINHNKVTLRTMQHLALSLQTLDEFPAMKERDARPEFAKLAEKLDFLILRLVVDKAPPAELITASVELLKAWKIKADVRGPFEALERAIINSVEQ
jgi:hypothetical protein